MTGNDQIRSKKRNTEIYLSTSKVLYSVEKKIIFFYILPQYLHPLIIVLKIKRDKVKLNRIMIINFLLYFFQG